MRKKIGFITLVLCMLFLFACQPLEKSENIFEESKEINTYLYNQDLNIINDNYRNYYEVFVYSFCDSDGDGIGDINGLISKLDYINDGDELTDSDLGFNGIWLMPIMQSTTYHKYDITDYYTVDEEYGTNDDFKKLAQECNKREIKLIIDFVFNHTSAKHPWFIEAVSYLEKLDVGEEPNLEECPYVEYYNFTKENKGDGYHKAGHSDYFYECMFWDQMPDLNLGSIKVRNEIELIADFWIEQGVDGFRLDAAKEFYSGSPDKNIEVLNWFQNYMIKKDPDIYIVAEVWDNQSKIAKYYESEITSIFNFPISQHDGMIMMTARNLPGRTGEKLAKDILSFETAYRNINPDFIDAPFISNHDTTRISAGCVNEEDSMKFSAGILLSLSGSPFVYYGEEIGMNSYGSKDENKRLPMHWTKLPNAETPNPPVAADLVEQKFLSAEEQKEDINSIYNYYKRAIRIRNENPEIARGITEIVEQSTTDEICVLKRTYENQSIYILYNVSEETKEIKGFDDLSIRGFLTVGEKPVIKEENVYVLPPKSILYLKK